MCKQPRCIMLFPLSIKHHITKTNWLSVRAVTWLHETSPLTNYEQVWLVMNCLSCEGKRISWPIDLKLSGCTSYITSSNLNVHVLCTPLSWFNGVYHLYNAYYMYKLAHTCTLLTLSGIFRTSGFHDPEIHQFSGLSHTFKEILTHRYEQDMNYCL